MASRIKTFNLLSPFRLNRRLPGPSKTAWGLSRPYSLDKPTRYQPQASVRIDESSVQAEFREGFAHVASFYSRLIKYTSLSIVSFLILLYGGYEGAHQWVEFVELAASPTADDYGWGEGSIENWSRTNGGGGTDSRLGYRGRHAVRAAWMALNWNEDTSVANAIEVSATGAARGSNPFEKQLHSALSYLSVAMQVAKSKATEQPSASASTSPLPPDHIDHLDKSDERIHDPTVADLTILNAAILARIGSPETLALSKPLLRQAIDYHSRALHHDRAAQLCMKLGDVCANLNDGEEASRWWMRGFGMLDPDLPHLLEQPSKLPKESQLSPLRERIILSGIVSLSGQYASSLRFDDALRLQDFGFQLAGSSLRSNAILAEPIVPERLLHRAYLLHRAALLRIHASEVLYARHRALETERSSSTTNQARRWFKSQVKSSQPIEANVIKGLTSAAQACEYVVQLLTSHATPEPVSTTVIPRSVLEVLTSSDSTTPTLSPSLPPSLSSSNLGPLPNPKLPLLSDFSSSRILSKSAGSCLRQAKRSAAESLKLVGILLEREPSSSLTATSPNSETLRQVKARDAEALEFYERALAWTGGGPDGRAGDDVIESDWQDVWNRYVRIRAKVLGGDGGTVAS